jgi:hypothetical protein
VAGLGFLAAIFSAAIAPASISTAIATAIARLRLKVFLFSKNSKNRKKHVLFTLTSYVFFLAASKTFELESTIYSNSPQ